MSQSSVAGVPATGDERLPRQLGRVPAFDGIRAIAVLLVVWSHAGLLHVLTPAERPNGGFLGVDAFFVLSGFLITALLLREQTRIPRIRLGAFYRRRALRLYPVVIAFVVAHYVFSRSLGLNQGRERSSLLALLFYYTNWKAIYAGPLIIVFGHLWSLAVEEQFYLVWPLVMMVLTVRTRTRTVAIALGAAILLVAVHRAVLYEHGVSTNRLLIATDTRADTLLVGALLAHLWVRGRVPKRGVAIAAWVGTAFFALCVARCKYTSPFLYRGGFTVLAVAIAFVLLAILETDWSGKRLLSTPPIRAIGRVSYGLYVWHPLVFFWIWFHTRSWNGSVRVAFALLVTALVTYLSWTFIEQPCLRWKDRLEARRPDRAVGSDAPR